MGKLDQRGVVHLLVPIILILGLIATVYLVTSGNPLNLFSRAGNPPIVFKSLDGGPLPVNEDDVYQANDPNVIVELTSPLGGPVSVSGPVSGPNQKGTVSYRVGFDLDQLNSAEFTPYLTEPTILNVGFADKADTQFYWVEFKDTDGVVERKSAQIEIVTQNEPSPSVIPTSSPSSGPTSGPSLTPQPKQTHRPTGGWGRQSEPSWSTRINEFWGKWLNQSWGGWGRPKYQPSSTPEETPDASQNNSSDDGSDNSSGAYPNQF